MNTEGQPLKELWLCGPVDGVIPLLQPIAHALLQAKEEVALLMQHFPESLLLKRPAGVASPAFHLQHLSGVLDRLFTYARAEALTPEQIEQLHAEGRDHLPEGISAAALIERFNNQADIAMTQLKNTDEKLLADFRGVGRKMLPSTVMGLLVHAAEHTMRHVGQLTVTVKILTDQNGPYNL